MPKKNQIPFLATQRLAGGRTGYYWKPSPKLRALGWKTLPLGEDFAKAVAAAIEQNRKLAGTGDIGATESAAGTGRAPVLWQEAERRYRNSAAFKNLSPASRRTYEIYLRPLNVWAKDGLLPMREFNGEAGRDLVWDFRNALVDSTESSRARTKLILSILSAFLKWCDRERIINGNPARGLEIPMPPPRKRRLLRAELLPLIESATALGYSDVALGIPLGFYTMQRQKDLLETTAFKIGPMTDISAFARRILADERGRVMGLALEQSKTGARVTIPLHPIARREVAQAIADLRKDGSCTNLILYPGEDRACTDHAFQRHFRDTVNHAVAALRAKAAEATDRQDHDSARTLEALAERLDGIMFRDLRRSGMCWMRDLGTSIAGISSISGHSIDQTQKILDTYMPRDERGAAEAMAMAVAREQELDAIEAAEREQER